MLVRDGDRKNFIEQSSKAHKQIDDYLKSLTKFDKEDTFEDEFAAHRDIVFPSCIQSVFSMNKRGQINGFNLKYLSLTSEHSVLYNYWSY